MEAATTGSSCLAEVWHTSAQTERGPEAPLLSGSLSSSRFLFARAVLVFCSTELERASDRSLEVGYRRRLHLRYFAGVLLRGRGWLCHGGYEVEVQVFFQRFEIASLVLVHAAADVLCLLRPL